MSEDEDEEEDEREEDNWDAFRALFFENGPWFFIFLAFIAIVILTHFGR